MDQPENELSHRVTVKDTYILDLEAQKHSALLSSLSRCYRSHEKEMEISNLLADAIRKFFVDGDDEGLTDALRAYRAHRYPEE